MQIIIKALHHLRSLLYPPPSTDVPLVITNLTITPDTIIIQRIAHITGHATLFFTLPQSLHHTLHTLSILDQGGAIESVIYPTPPLSEHSLHTLLRDAMGAVVDLYTIYGKIQGVIQRIPITVTSDITNNNPSTTTNHHVVLRQQNGSPISLPLSTIKGLTFHDPILQHSLNTCKPPFLPPQPHPHGHVTITTSGESDIQRLINVSYTIDTPKYDIIYKFYIQPLHNLLLHAWYTFHNTLEEDLQHVHVVVTTPLVLHNRHSRNVACTGHPIRERCIVTNNQPSNIVNTCQINHTHSCVSQRTLHDDRLLTPSPPMPSPSPTSSTPPKRASTAASHEYLIKGALTIRAHETALLPLITTTVPGGGGVNIFTPRLSRSHALHGVWLRNTTDAPFPTGSVEVYDHGTLLGQPVLPPCFPGEDALLPCRINPNCPVDITLSDPVVVTACVAQRGRFVVERSSRKICCYSFPSGGGGGGGGGGGEVVVVLHDLENGYGTPSAILSIDDTTEGDGETLHAMLIDDLVARYDIHIDTAATMTLTVTESRTEFSEHEIRGSCTTSKIGYLLHERAIGPRTAGYMRDVVAKQGELQEARAEIQRLKERVEGVEKTQRRYRENIVALGAALGRGRQGSGAVVAAFVERFRVSESRLEELVDMVEERVGRVVALEKEIEEIVDAFDGNSALV